jgi:hypothetical protein
MPVPPSAGTQRLLAYAELVLRPQFPVELHFGKLNAAHFHKLNLLRQLAKMNHKHGNTPGVVF